MTPARVLIVDDEPLARERLRRLLPPHNTQLVGEAWSRESAIVAIRQLHPDVVLLDVELPDGTGFDVLSELSRDTLPLVVFVTAHDAYAVRAFDAAAADYVLKPVDPERFDEAMRRVLARLPEPAADGRRARLDALLQAYRAERGRVVLREDGRSHFVEAAQILWIEAKRNNCLVHLLARTIVVRETLQDLLARLPAHSFARAHRSTIVNLAHIRYAEPYFRGEHVLVLTDGTRIVTSRLMGAALHDLLRKQRA